MHTYQIIAYTKKLKAKNMRNKRMWYYKIYQWLYLNDGIIVC